MRLHRKIILIPIVLILLAGAAALGTGCGEEKPETPLVPAGEQAETTDAADSAAAIEALGPGDLPTEIGNRRVYAANEAGTGATVSFSTEGPWDFSTGPDAATLTITIISKETAPRQDRFPDATIAARHTWTPQPSRTEYSFQDLDQAAWMAFGRSGREDEQLVVFPSPSRVLVFPATVGKSWTDNFSQYSEGRTIEVVAENTIVAFNSLTVPAGTFNAFLLQTKITTREGENTATAWDYMWLVPGIGRAAEIVSRPGETDEVFSTAYAFYRLRDY